MIITALADGAASSALKIRPMMPEFEDIPVKARVKTEHGIRGSGMWLDFCNDDLVGTKIIIPAGVDGNLRGWALDSDADKPLKAFYVKVGDTFFTCNYGIEKPSVSNTFKNPNFLKTGFSVMIPSRYFERVSEIDFIAIGFDGSYQYDPITYPVEVIHNE